MNRFTRSKLRRRSASRPRVGVDFHTFDGIFQGSRSHLLGLYREAVVRAPDLDFVLLLADPERLRGEHPVFDAPNVDLVAMRALPGVARLGWQLAWHQYRQRLDLLHVQYRLPLLTWGPCACTIHDVLFETHPEYFPGGFVRMSRATSRQATRRAAPLFTVSEYSRATMSRIYRVPETRIAVTSNAVDTRRFHPGTGGRDRVRALGLEPGEYLLTVGRLEPRKNHQVLIEAYAGLAAPRPPLVIVGQRDFGFETLFEQVQARGLAGQVRFMERVEDADLPALLRHARVFVYPTWAEGFGMPVLEALASGVPTIASSATSLPEVAGEAARLVDPADVQALSKAIGEDLELDADARAARVAAGLVRVAEFDWGASAEVLLAGFRSRLRELGRLDRPDRPGVAPTRGGRVVHGGR